MKKIIHRYVRRLVVWCGTLSDEEEARRHREARLARRARLARNVRNALLTERHYAEWTGLNAEDARRLIEDVRAIGAGDPMISQASVDRLVAFLQPCTFTRPAAPPQSEDVA